MKEGETRANSMATKETSGGERGKRAAIVFFFCGQMEAEYELAAKSLAEFGIRLGRVNGPAEKELADSLHVGAWPTLKVFRKGRSFDYRGASFFCFFVSLFCFLFVVVVVLVVLSPESVLFAFSDPGSSSFGTTTAQSVCSGANTVMEL